MMRLTRTTRTARIRKCATRRRRKAAGTGSVLTHAVIAWAAILAAASLAMSGPALAQTGDTSFPKTKGGMFGPTQKIDNSLPLYLQGDQLVYDTKGNRVIARGNVEIFYNDNLLKADEVIYDQNAATLTAVGNVELKEKNGNIVRAERYTLTDDFRDGFVQSLSVVTQDDSRITAERAERREGNVNEFTNAKFTPCKSNNGMPPLWCISAKKIVHDQQAKTVSYKDAYFELFGQPVFYLPYFEHPDAAAKRKSGFLMPEYGTSEDLGFGVTVPYYWVIAPNIDATFSPTYYSKQGVLYQGEFRHRTENGQYTVRAAGIDQDPADLPEGTTGQSRDSLDGWRGTVETKGKFSLSSWWNYGWDVTLESDDTFRRFYKLDNVLLTDRVNNAYVVGQSERSYLAANLYHFGGLLLNDTAESESFVHPIIDHNYVFQQPVLGGELRWNNNFMSFTRTDFTAAGQDQEFTRGVSEMKWRRRLTDTLGITYTPFGELRGDVYQLDNYLDPVSGAFVSNETITRGRATAGVTVSYPWVAHTANASHVVEPIGQIVTHEASDSHRRLPNEDARSLVFDDTNLFETDKFSGYDRFETGTRVNAGVQYTFQSADGGYMRVLAGESYHLKGSNSFADPGTDPDDHFLFSPTSGLERDRSDYILAAYLAPIDSFRLISQSRFDQDNGELRREDLSLRMDYGPLFAQSTYTYTAADPLRGLEISQQDILASMGLRLTDRWSLAASIRYDIDDDQRLMDAIQLRYQDECFMLSATYQETFINDPERDISPDRSVMLRFELKHLGGYSYKTDVLDHTYGTEQPPTP